MTQEQFSIRQGFAPKPSVPYDDVPMHVRILFRKLLYESIEPIGRPLVEPLQILFPYFEPLISEFLQREPPRYASDPMWYENIADIIKECPWFNFYDICEDMHKLISQVGDKDKAEAFALKANQIFERYGLVWHFRNGLIEGTGSEYVNKVVEKARVLIREQGFEGPDEQFEKAIRFLNQRPLPDTENCVKDAVGSLEGVARTISQDAKALLPDIIDREPFRSEIHRALREAIKRVYGYRGDEGGVAHGQVGASQVGVEEAEFVLGVCASAIVYLVNKFGKQSP